MTSLRLRIRELRESRGLSQDALATAAGVRQATISELERRRGGKVDLDVLERIARVLDVAPGELIDPQTPRRKK